MGSCRNALEELVIEEAKAQIKRLPIHVQQEINLSEVVAFALNRLPAMYATTQRGWLQQRKRAKDEYGAQIVSAVRQALLGVRRDPLRQAVPLPPAEIVTPARALAQLQTLLRKPDLKWKEVPGIVADALADIRIKGAISNTNRANTLKRSATDIKSYLRRSKTHSDSWQQGQPNTANLNNASEQALRVAAEAREFESYMSGAMYDYTNTLESLVISVVERQLQRLHPDLRDRITIEDVAAYALNRLPTMYATSSQGLRQLRNRARSEYANQILAAVKEAIVKVANMPNRLLPPLPFEKFNLEQEESLAELRTMLKREDIDWRNVVDVISETLESASNQNNSHWTDLTDI